jgi:anti-sigma regulatory factor (Ser/Thr protein kinase)
VSPDQELPHSFSQSFAADLNAPAAARSAIRRLGGHVDDDLVERGRLVVTELVSNSVKHAGLTPEQQIKLRVSASRDLLQLEVIDDGDGFDPTRPKLARYDGGWGLSIVADLSDRWEVDLSNSTRVWCEFATRTDPEPGHGR